MPSKYPSKVSCICVVCTKTFFRTPHHAIRRGRTRYCSFACSVVGHTRPAAVRLAERLAPANENGCILWLGSTRRGYGNITAGNGRGPVAVHRLAWELAHGPIPPGLLVCHKCDVRTCCNVDHLFLGTAADNSRDMVLKGRNQVMRTRLTEGDVIQIRTLHQSGVSRSQIAKQFGASTTLIRYVINRKLWKHI